MTLAEIADLLHETPHLVWTHVQEQQGSEESNSPHRKEGGSGFYKNTRRVTLFVCLLSNGEKLIRREASTLAEALHTAFRDLNAIDPNVKMPAQIKATFKWTFPKTKSS